MPKRSNEIFHQTQQTKKKIEKQIDAFLRISRTFRYLFFILLLLYKILQVNMQTWPFNRDMKFRFRKNMIDFFYRVPRSCIN